MRINRDADMSHIVGSQLYKIILGDAATATPWQAGLSRSIRLAHTGGHFNGLAGRRQPKSDWSPLLWVTLGLLVPVLGWRRSVTVAEDVAAAWRALGRELAAHRQAHGFSQEQLGALLGYSRSTVANVETGRQHVLGDFWRKCDAALGTNDSLISAYDEVKAAARREHVRIAAIAQLTRAEITADAMSATACGLEQIELVRQGLSSALGEGAVGESTLDDWEETVLRYGRATRGLPSGVLLVDLAADLAELQQIIGRCRPVSSLRRLARVTAHMSGLMCLTFVKLDERTAARRWARTARHAAREADDPATFSWVLAQEAYGHFYSGDLTGAVSVARHAQDLVGAAPCVGAALAAALEARANAVRGDRRETRCALSRAEAALSRLDADSTTASAFGYTESQLRFHEGNAYTHLHDTRSAHRAQERALQLCPPGDYTDWAMIRLDHASCLLHDSDAAGAVAYAADTLASLSAAQRRGIIALRGREIVHALLARHRAVPAVRELRELVMPAPEMKRKDR